MQDRSRPRRGRPRKLDHDRIADAVIRRGFVGLTVDDVAADLGVGSATLYRYFPTRGELLALAWDRVLVGADWPGDGPWDAMLMAQAVTLWRLSAAHPGAVSSLSHGPVPPAMMRLYDDLAAALIRRGFGADDAVLAVDSVIDLTIDHRLGIERLDALASGEMTLRAELATGWARHDPTDGGGAQELAREGMLRAIRTDPEEWFRRKLDLVIAGIRQKSSPPPPE